MFNSDILAPYAPRCQYDIPKMMNYNVDMMNLLKLTNLLNPLNLISMGNTTITIRM